MEDTRAKGYLPYGKGPFSCNHRSRRIYVGEETPLSWGVYQLEGDWETEGLLGSKGASQLVGDAGGARGFLLRSGPGQLMGDWGTHFKEWNWAAGGRSGVALEEGGRHLVGAP